MDVRHQFYIIEPSISILFFMDDFSGVIWFSQYFSIFQVPRGFSQGMGQKSKGIFMLTDLKLVAVGMSVHFFNFFKLLPY